MHRIYCCKNCTNQSAHICRTFLIIKQVLFRPPPPPPQQNSLNIHETIYLLRENTYKKLSANTPSLCFSSFNFLFIHIQLTNIFKTFSFYWIIAIYFCPYHRTKDRLFHIICVSHRLALSLAEKNH